VEIRKIVFDEMKGFYENMVQQVPAWNHKFSTEKREF